jgi:hypothetical protein
MCRVWIGGRVDRYGGPEGLSTMEQSGVGTSSDVRPAALGSGLVIELDRHQARAVLFGSVEGQGRFIASSTTASTTLPPIDDASVGVKQAIRDIEEQTGQALLGADGVQLPPSEDIGVNYLATTGQPAPPVRLTVLATGASSVATALIAAARRAISVVDVVGAEVRSAEGNLTGAALEQRVRDFRPDSVVLAEGQSAEAEWTTAAGTLAALVHEGVLSQIIIVAREHFQQIAAQVFGEHADLRGIDPSEFSTAEIAAALESELNAIYEARLDARATVQSSVPSRFVSLVRAGDLVTRFVARRRNVSVVSVSAGDGTVVHRASMDAGETAVRPEFDLAHNIRGALALDPRAIAQWLPFTMSNEDITHWVLNRALRPFSVAASPRDEVIESALLTAYVRQLGDAGASAAAEIDMLIGGRPTGGWRSPGLAVFALLNAFQPAPATGLVEVVLDSDGLLPAAGALGEQSPALAADAVELDLLRPAATVIVVTGSGSEGDLAVRGQLRHGDGDAVRFTVPYGSIHHMPLPDGQHATLTLSCEPRFSIGAHPSTDEMVFGRATPLLGSEVGLIIDARGRPLPAVSDPTLQAARVATWLEDLGVRIS